jgi:putative sigma-54 modulation protein
MQIEISGHHLEITNAIRNNIEAKFSKLYDHYPSIQRISLILEVEKREHSAEAIIHVPGENITVKAISDDMYASIAQAESKAETRLKAIKNADIAAKRHNGESVPLVDPVDTVEELMTYSGAS